jgi:hypothetical protein
LWAEAKVIRQFAGTVGARTHENPLSRFLTGSLSTVAAAASIAG